MCMCGSLLYCPHNSAPKLPFQLNLEVGCLPILSLFSLYCDFLHTRSGGIWPVALCTPLGIIIVVIVLVTVATRVDGRCLPACLLYHIYALTLLQMTLTVEMT